MSAVIILGMHRSGTSCLTGCLEEAGLFLGAVQRSNPHNPRGNQENREVMDLHDSVLATNGGSWKAPPLPPVSWSDDQRAWRDQIIAGYPTDEVWGFKDPRTLFTLDGWIEAVPEARFIGSVRHPTEVVQSLMARHPGSERRDWWSLWTVYSRRLAELHDTKAFPIIDFNLPPDEYSRSVLVAAERLGLPSTNRSFRFYDAKLVHHVRPKDPQKGELPDQVAELYSHLVSLANTA